MSPLGLIFPDYKMGELGLPRGSFCSEVPPPAPSISHVTSDFPRIIDPLHPTGHYTRNHEIPHLFDLHWSSTGQGAVSLWHQNSGLMIPPAAGHMQLAPRREPPAPAQGQASFLQASFLEMLTIRFPHACPVAHSSCSIKTCITHERQWEPGLFLIRSLHTPTYSCLFFLRLP